jgi:hypothetical protein
MKFDDYLEQASLEDSVAEILKEIHPILEEKMADKQASPWEMATALMIELASLSASADLNKTILLNLFGFLIEVTNAYTDEFGEVLPNSTFRRH